MRPQVLAGLAAAWLLAGCSGDSGKPVTSTNTTSSGSSPADGSGGYLGALTRAQQTAVKTVDTTSLNQAIERFNVDKERYPKDLNELVQEKYIPQIPATPYGTKLEYDPAAGKVSVVKQ